MSEELLDAAREAARHASVPYSRFPVGAAVLATSGQVYSGCNVESASYGLTCCAERAAIFSTIAAGAQPASIAVTCLKGDPAHPDTLMPCGACRQVMLDQMGPQATVLVDRVGSFTVADLLPRGFRLPDDEG